MFQKKKTFTEFQTRKSSCVTVNPGGVPPVLSCPHWGIPRARPETGLWRGPVTGLEGTPQKVHGSRGWGTRSLRCGPIENITFPRISYKDVITRLLITTCTKKRYR